MGKPAYQFVDNIRCIAMFAIVIEHTSYLGSYVYAQSASPYWAYLTSIQLVKFGTIAFFIIAGFLFSENNGNYAFFDYIKRRFNNVFKPWLIWSSVFLILLTGGTFITSLQEGVPFRLILSSVWWGMKTTYLHSNYWFIVNFFFCTTVLLLSRNIIRSWKFGLFLFSLTSFYSINVYTEWITPQHTTAIFGFIFFYWLGVQLNVYLPVLEKKIEQTSVKWFVLATVVTLMLGVLEASYLYGLHKVDPINTLRISNIIFSLTVFIMFLKIKNFDWLSVLQPRKTTYGIFLVHYILVWNFLPALFGKLDVEIIKNFTIMDMYKLQFTRFLIVYTLSYVIVRFIAKSNLSWVIGIKTAKPVVKTGTYYQVNPQEGRALETEAA